VSISSKIYAKIIKANSVEKVTTHQGVLLYQKVVICKKEEVDSDRFSFSGSKKIIFFFAIILNHS